MAWVFLTYYFVYLQTAFVGYLLVSVGAFCNLLAYQFLGNPHLAVTIAVVSKVLFVAGIDITATVRMNLEKERLRGSSWSEIFLGIVPQPLRVKTLDAKDQIVPSLISSFLFATVFYVVRDKLAALGFFVFGAIFVAYYCVWLKKN